MAGILVATGAFALGPTEIVEAWKPIICWQNLVTVTTISADFETAADPASNMANPSTSWRWTSSSTALQYLPVLFGAERDVEYAGMVRHNWASGLVSVSIEGLPFGGDPNDDGDWVEVFAPHYLSDDGARVWRFTKTAFIGLRWKLQPDAVAPFAAVAMCGEVITLPYGVPPGHVPIKFGDTTEQRDVGNQGGDHLGLAIITRKRSGNIVQQRIDPAWYRARLEPFRQGFRDGDTFLFVWAPDDYPDEAGYCWRAGDATPSISQTTGEVDITFPINAVAL